MSNPKTTFTHAQKMKLASQHVLAMRLMQWHGGQASGLYAVASCMLADCRNGEIYDPRNHRGHHTDSLSETQGELLVAVRELRREARDGGGHRASRVRDLTALAARLMLLA